LFTGEYVIVRIFPAIPFGLLIRIEYLSYFLAVLFGNQLFKLLYPDEYFPWQTRIVQAVTAIFSALVILTPITLFTKSIFIFYLFSLLVIIYIVIVCGIAVKRGRRGALIFLVGVLVMAIATVNDNLYSSFIINTGNFVDLGMIVFVFCQALVLSLRLTEAFTREEQLSHQLAELNAGLEVQVETRTAELRAACESIKELSIRDQLTGCFNRLFLNEQFPKEIDRALRYGHSLSVIMADIDHFKKINDSCGHQAGDAVLAEIGRIFIGSLRDKVDWAFRYGGEEFVVLIPETDLEGATVVAEKLRRNIAEAVVATTAGPISVTASFGVSGFGSPPLKSEVSMKEMINEVDTLLYQAKEAGRNRVVAAALPKR
jgi:diguanylate cyclase (GGDEF)-like protein